MTSGGETCGSSASQSSRGTPSHQRVPGFILAAIKLRSCFCQDWQDCACHEIGCLRLTCLSDPATRVLDLEPELSELNNKDPSRYPSLYNPVLATILRREGQGLLAAFHEWT